MSNGGNLLLNIGPDADGAIPQVMQDRLLEMGAWLRTNGESIYGCGAGPFRNPPWGRSTAKAGRVYLHLYTWPKGQFELRGLKNAVKRAWLLADPERKPLEARQEEGLLRIALPAEPPDKWVSVVALEIAGQAEIDTALHQAPDGSITLPAGAASIHGKAARYESGGAKDNIGYWSDANDWVSWEFVLAKPGMFEVEVIQACALGSGGGYTIAVAGQQLQGKVKETGCWDRYASEKLGEVKLEREGRFTLTLKPTEKVGEALMNLRAVILRSR